MNVHVQSFHGVGIWKTEGLQFLKSNRMKMPRYLEVQPKRTCSLQDMRKSCIIPKTPASLLGGEVCQKNVQNSNLDLGSAKE